MSTPDVPGAKKENRDVLDVGCWAEHSDGSLILVEGLEAGSVIYSIFDMIDPPVEYRDAMPEKGFKDKFSWKGGTDIKWTWHDKTKFPWKKIMREFPSGEKAVSAVATMTAAQRVAESLHLRAQKLREDVGEFSPEVQKLATDIMRGIQAAIENTEK